MWGGGGYLYLPRSLHVDGDDLEAVAAELAGPAAALADPLQQAVLVGVPDRTVTPAGVQQVALRAHSREILQLFTSPDRSYPGFIKKRFSFLQPDFGPFSHPSSSFITKKNRTRLLPPEGLTNR